MDNEQITEKGLILDLEQIINKVNQKNATQTTLKSIDDIAQKLKILNTEKWQKFANKSSKYTSQARGLGPSANYTKVVDISNELKKIIL